MVMKVLVVGGGGREHAIATALSRNTDVSLYAVMAKKNPGIAKIADKILLHPETDVRRIAEYAMECGADFAVIGPEAPLEAGIVDVLESRDVACIGPTGAAARLETDKGFCRNMMEKHGVAGCPHFRVFHSAEDACEFVDEYDGDLAIKPIGLTGGKGVRIIGEHLDREEAKEYITSIKGEVVLEERLIGEEFTLQAFVDGKHLVPMPLVQDHKRAYEGDVGPNTGGMGSYSMADHSLPFVAVEDYKKALEIMKDVVISIKREGFTYRGILYGQFMNTAEGPKVIEFNARFGDPEAMNVLSLLSSDFAEIVGHIAYGTLSKKHVTFDPYATVCKYIVPEGYPVSPMANQPIEMEDWGAAHLYFANVVERNEVLYTQTSRSLAFVGIGETLEDAERVAESAVSKVSGHVRHRRDIGTPEVLERRIAHMREIR
jgi:phosphoribosylamine--glycine ligase